MGGACGAPRLLGIYLISKMHTKTIQKIQKAYLKTYEEDVKIYKDIENSQGTLLLQKCRPLYQYIFFFKLIYTRAGASTMTPRLPQMLRADGSANISQI